MRATSPLDQLQYFGDVVALPTPRYPVGTRVNAQLVGSEDREYYGVRTLQTILRDTRKVVGSLVRQGYLSYPAGRKLPDFSKAQIRAKLDMMRFADSVEIAGAQPVAMHAVGTIGNQCYLRNGQCHSGVSYEYFFLFRREVDGNKLVYIHPYALVRQEHIASMNPQPPLQPIKPPSSPE